MLPVFSSNTIKHIEQASVEREQIELFELMQRAGQAAFDLLQDKWPAVRKLLVVTGSGNNAGDALTVARLAIESGYQVQLVAIRPLDQLSGDAELAWQQLQSLDYELIDIERVGVCDLIIDGILGTGFNGELRPAYRNTIQRLNLLKLEQQIPILSLDIASGIYADSGLADRDYIQADATISYIASKLGHWLDYGLDARGELFHATLGADYFFQDQQKDKFSPVTYKLCAKHLAQQLPKRHRNIYKNQAGHLLCIGGTKGTVGAILLTAETAIKSGAGMVTCGLDVEAINAALSRCPEVMWQAPDAELRHQYQALALGPGLGSTDWAKELFNKFMQMPCPKVIDADALYWLAKNQHPALEMTESVLTPHLGEAATLLSWDTAKVRQDRLVAAKTIANQYQTVVVLKGAGTIVTDGERSVIASGAHPAMATAGLGDVLTGLIGSLLVQGLDAWQAAILGVQIHFMAAQRAAGTRDRGMLASELIPQINQLINGVEQVE